MIRIPRGKIAVDPMFDSDRSPTGLIIIPDEAKNKCDQGIVRYVGPEVDDIKVGDHVLFSAYSGTTVRVEGEGLFIILHADFVTCVIESPDTEIPGLFFRGLNAWSQIRVKLLEKLQRINFKDGLSDMQLDEIIAICQPEYWPATREMATSFIADAVATQNILEGRQRNTKPDEIRRGG